MVLITVSDRRVTRNKLIRKLVGLSVSASLACATLLGAPSQSAMAAPHAMTVCYKTITVTKGGLGAASVSFKVKADNGKETGSVNSGGTIDVSQLGLEDDTRIWPEVHVVNMASGKVTSVDGPAVAYCRAGGNAQYIAKVPAHERSSVSLKA
ncbi:hypothetical protein GCM10010211_77820 [Streptomyces albospinus]|uniref:Uncharacterized protein n=2 Tax=Streptomyces albospinus TaxID=285515 RepID=A0ABQ2VPI3_9ACTN|nr:hypothetical protein GCM10010211_77820 [Streptomyces albospinus]